MGTVPNCPFSRFNLKKIKMKAALLIVIAGLAMASALPKPSSQISLQMTYQQTMKAKSIQCDMCKLLVTQLEDLIFNAQTTDELVQMVEQLCSQLDGVFPGFGATCNSFVETYMPAVIEQIENELAPTKVCQALTLCSTGSALRF